MSAELELDEGGAHVMLTGAPAFDPDTDGAACSRCGAYELDELAEPVRCAGCDAELGAELAR